MKSIVPTIFLIGLLLTNYLATGFAQQSNSARIVDAFPDVDCDDAMARLDRFAEFLNVPGP